MKKIIYTITLFALLSGTIACSSDDKDDPLVAIQQLSLPSSLAIAVGGTEQLTPTTMPANITKPYTLVWSSDNEGVATVDEEGNVTAVEAGTANIRAQVHEDDQPQNIAAATRVTVENYTITLSETSGKVDVGSTITLEPTVTPAGATYILVWESSNETIASVVDGVITGRNEGQATITVHVQQQPDIKATFTVDVGVGEANPGGSVGDIPDGDDW